MNSSLLAGITRPGSQPPRLNPGVHAPVALQNRAVLERWQPGEKPGDPPILAQHVEHVGNLACTRGLNHLCELLVTGAVNFSASNGWVQVGAIGTDNTAANSNDTALGGSTASVHISGASMAAADGGNRTYEAQMTFTDANPYTVNEIGLFASSTPADNMIARIALAASDQVIKGTADTINATYQLIFTT